MSFSAVSSSPTSQASTWEHAFVPETSTSWKGKPLCVDEFDENPNCCASGYDIDAILETAYEDGLEDHPGVKALGNKPCVNSSQLESLADELAHMSYLKEKKQPSSSIPGLPDFININEPTYYIGDRRVFRYCDELLFNTLSHSYGTLKSIPQKVKLGENFKAVVDYCADVIVERVPIFDILTNKFKEDD